MLFQARAQRRRALRRTELTVLVVARVIGETTTARTQSRSMGFIVVECQRTLWSELRHPSLELPVLAHTRVVASRERCVSVLYMKPSEVAAVALPISMGAALVAVLFLMGLNLTLDDMRAVRARGRSPSRSRSSSSSGRSARSRCASRSSSSPTGRSACCSSPSRRRPSARPSSRSPSAATRRPRRELGRLLLSAVAMPASFVAEVVLFNALGRAARPAGGRASRVTLRLPLAQIAAMLVLVLTAAGGLAAQHKCAEARRERAKVWIKRALKVVVPVCVVSFVMTDALLSATYYGGDGAWRSGSRRCSCTSSRSRSRPRPRGASARPRATRSSSP